MKTFITPEGYILDWRLRQRMAPIMGRLIESLEQEGNIADHELAKRIFADRSSVSRYLARLHEAGIIRISGWNTAGGGDYQRLWSMRDGKPDAEKPVVPPTAYRSRRRRKKIQELFGRGAYLVLQGRKTGGADVVIRDGKVLYRRGEGVNYEAAEQVRRNRNG